LIRISRAWHLLSLRLIENEKRHFKNGCFMLGLKQCVGI